jgi:hypothetical protein
VQVSLEPPAEPPPVLNKNKNIQIKKRNKHFSIGSYHQPHYCAPLLISLHIRTAGIYIIIKPKCTNKNTGITYMFFCNSFNCRTKRGPVSHWALYSAQTFAQVAVFEDVTQFFVDLSSIIFAYLRMDKKMLN